MGVKSQNQFLLNYLMKFCPVFLGFFAIAEVTKSQCNRRLQRRLQIFLNNFTSEVSKTHVKY